MSATETVMLLMISLRRRWASAVGIGGGRRRWASAEDVGGGRRRGVVVQLLVMLLAAGLLPFQERALRCHSYTV